jgi:hypothetical protein
MKPVLDNTADFSILIQPAASQCDGTGIHLTSGTSNTHARPERRQVTVTAGREGDPRPSFNPCTEASMRVDEQAGHQRKGKAPYALALAFGVVVLAYFLLNRSTRPSASTIFWVPVKKG